MLTFMHPWVLYIAGFCLLAYAAIWYFCTYHAVYHVPTTYLFLRYMHHHSIVCTGWKRYLRYALRGCAIIALICALARPRQPDERSAVRVEGRDMVLALDVSQSMMLFDDRRDPRSRWEVVQSEARRFIAHRPYDPIGLVYFGAFALSRCPITLDTKLLDQIVRDTQLGDINPYATMLGQAIALSIQRLRYSSCHNRLLILLTDGSPSEHDTPIDEVLSMAQKAGIRIYTIGVGSEKGGYFSHPLFGVQQFSDSVDFSLLSYIARQTGGSSFRAENPQEIKQVYDQIDALEATEHDAPEYTRYYEYFIPCLWLAYICCLLEVVLTTFIWVTL